MVPRAAFSVEPGCKAHDKSPVSCRNHCQGQPSGKLWLACFSLLFSFSATAQLRIVDYNTGGAARPSLSTVLAAMGAESVNGIAKAPDVFTLQEQGSSATTTQAIVEMLNDLYGTGTYSRATEDGGTSGGGRVGLIFNSRTTQLIAQTDASTVSTSGAARETQRYQLRPVGYDSAADFYVYASHYKASNDAPSAARRHVEAQEVRANGDALGSAHLIYAGDFNVYTSSEAMFQTLTAPGPGQAFDPINRPVRGRTTLPSRTSILSRPQPHRVTPDKFSAVWTIASTSSW